jgi:hypothetical protein
MLQPVEAGFGCAAVLFERESVDRFLITTAAAAGSVEHF